MVDAVAEAQAAAAAFVGAGLGSGDGGGGGGGGGGGDGAGAGTSSLSGPTARAPPFSPLSKTFGRAAVLAAPTTADAGSAAAVDMRDIEFAEKATGSVVALLERLEQAGEGKVELGELDEFD